MSPQLRHIFAVPAPLRQACLLAALVLTACGDESDTVAGPDIGNAPSLATASSNTWVTVARTPDDNGAIVGSQVAGVLPDASGRSLVYVFGGYSSLDGGAVDQVLVYSVASNSWTARTLGSPASTVSLTEFNGVGTIGNQFFLAGGITRGSFEGSWLPTLYAYNPTTGQTTRKADMPIASGGGVSGVIDGKLYVLPGICSTELWPDPGYCQQEATRRFFRYNPATNSWATRPWSPHYHKCAAAGVIDGKFYVAGGRQDFTNVTDLDVYDPVTNKWKTLAALPRAGCATGGVMNHKLFVISGLPFAGGPFPMYAYDPATNSWSSKAAPSAARAAARVVVNGRNRLFSAGPPSQLYTP